MRGPCSCQHQQTCSTLCFCADGSPAPLSLYRRAAQQEAERARFVVEKAKQEKRSIVIRAQGEAASAEMIGRSISDKPGFVELRRIDAARDIAQIVSRSSNRVYLNADSLLLNLLGDTGASACVPATATVHVCFPLPAHTRTRAHASPFAQAPQEVERPVFPPRNPCVHDARAACVIA